MPRSPQKPYNRVRAFTLIELLVAMAIIAILSALSFSGIQRVRASADQARCGGNMRSIAVALSAYANENNGYFPAVRSNSGNADSADGRQNKLGTWEAEIEPYVGYNLRNVMGGYAGSGSDDIIQTLMICDVGEFVGMNANLNGEKVPIDGKNINWGLDFQTRVNSIKEPAKTLLVGDSDQYHLSFSRNMTPNAAGKYSGADVLRHNGKANYVFVDGHLESMTPDEVLQLQGLK